MRYRFSPSHSCGFPVWETRPSTKRPLVPTLLPVHRTRRRVYGNVPTVLIGCYSRPHCVSDQVFRPHRLAYRSSAFPSFDKRKASIHTHISVSQVAGALDWPPKFIEGRWPYTQTVATQASLDCPLLLSYAFQHDVHRYAPFPVLRWVGASDARVPSAAGMHRFAVFGCASVS